MANGLVIGIAVVAIAGVAAMIVGSRTPPEPVAVIMPETLTAQARAGQQAFGEHCAACHGAQAQGTGQGPPLVHVIYEPNHHGDGAFHLAARNGVSAHHWHFGDMPPVPSVSERQVQAMIAYVRELQKANGVF